MKIDKRHFSKVGFTLGASKIKLIFWHLFNVLVFSNRFIHLPKIKPWILRLFGAHVGRNCVIMPDVYIKYPWKLKLGNYVSLGIGVFIDNYSRVEIGDHSTISQGAIIETGNHNYKSIGFDFMSESIVIEDGVWICLNCVVVAPAVIKSHSIILPHSVLTGETEPYGIYRGNLAIKIKERKLDENCNS